MREITDHVMDTEKNTLRICVLDQPGVGGASQHYHIGGFDPSANPSWIRPTPPAPHSILFQHGLLSERGVNGVTNEALLAIIADRLRSFQAGPYACRENALALTKIEESLHWLRHRHLARQQRSVSDTHIV